MGARGCPQIPATSLPIEVRAAPDPLSLFGLLFCFFHAFTSSGRFRTFFLISLSVVKVLQCSISWPSSPFVLLITLYLGRVLSVPFLVGCADVVVNTKSHYCCSFSNYFLSAILRLERSLRILSLPPCLVIVKRCSNELPFVVGSDNSSANLGLLQNSSRRNYSWHGPVFFCTDKYATVPTCLSALLGFWIWCCTRTRSSYYCGAVWHWIRSSITL